MTQRCHLEAAFGERIGLSNETWELVGPLLPPERGRGCRPAGDNRPPGEAHDVQGFGPLFRIITGKVRALLAGRGYNADAIRTEIALHGMQAIISAKRGREHSALHDGGKCRLRSRIEQLFSKLKN